MLDFIPSGLPFCMERDTAHSNAFYLFIFSPFFLYYYYFFKIFGGVRWPFGPEIDMS